LRMGNGQLSPFASSVWSAMFLTQMKRLISDCVATSM
jgi:hypothetical protein